MQLGTVLLGTVLIGTVLIGTGLIGTVGVGMGRRGHCWTATPPMSNVRATR